MDYATAFAISAAGMNLERSRVEIAALNLANANTIQGADGVSYRPMRVVARASALAGVDSAGVGADRFGDLVRAGLLHPVASALTDSIPTIAIESTQSSPRMVYEPGHPMADARGFVAYAGVDTATEIVTLMGAMRSYEANVAAMNTARTMALKALDIGGNNA